MAVRTEWTVQIPTHWAPGRKNQSGGRWRVPQGLAKITNDADAARSGGMGSDEFM
jgi:hypothetical protein